MPLAGGRRRRRCAALQGEALLRRQDGDVIGSGRGPQAHFDAADAHVVAYDAVGDLREVERARGRHSELKQLLIEVDLPVRTEPALDEPLEPQEFFVSSSTLEQHAHEREVVVGGDDRLARRGTRREQAGDGQEEMGESHGDRHQKRKPDVKSTDQSSPT